MTTNPSHILIARGSRGHNPSAALSSPTETHAAASGIFRNGRGRQHRLHSHGSAHGTGTLSGQWVIEESEADSEQESEDSDVPFEDVELDLTFTREGRFPGTVKIVVEGTTFWAHREILVFASPFFEAALSGDWSETRVDEGASITSGAARRQSIASSVITIPQPPSNPRDASKDVPTGISHVASDPDTSPEDADIDDLKNELEALNTRTGTSGETSDVEKDKVRDESLNQLEGKAGPLPSSANANANIARVKRKKSATGAEAKIVLKEEKASVFHDFLKFVYPHLECSITWNNVEGLMNISSKLCVPALTKQCLTFLLTHAAGKPIKAMRIAELFEEEHLYRESSRFVLDNPGGWSESEMSTLSQETLLKLEKRRNWFLERVLKLGLVNVAKEYQCCNTCPDPPTCARLLDERWRQAYNSCFRFGPCQPSMVYRYLRGLEGVTPPLTLTHLNCQNNAKAFTTTLFDRMFSLGVRGSGSGADPAPLGGRVPGVQGPAAGPRRHFLYCSLNP
ncbi:uncharacterized protein FOMMEDRAFT_122870 [Fomitiporia mediterranea MF3/22]|uniref:uncharacterized protein n=1 Tax=Fomitiporia mediterranea (strain MF3/22) TaxID=694068 RepID=UPI0004407F0C|nr:uncharacterized protein FOMMEDRAFT_122870 [Fomitiporia mediterranea MF3/22]EJD02810.1 hypothetical protein FOMMEDRAFT_122870 [Fomitiporia mediterranea MF3/22]